MRLVNWVSAKHDSGQGKPYWIADPDSCDAPLEYKAADVAYGHGDQEVTDKGDDSHGDHIADTAEGIGIGNLKGIPELVGQQDIDQGGYDPDDFFGGGE